jgi:hypothetical protein
MHPMAPHHPPAFVAVPGETDTLMAVMVVFVIAAVIVLGNLYLRLHALPERMAHRNKKFQFELVAVLGLLALFTHNNIFWIAALLLAIIDIPDYRTPLVSIAESLRSIAGGGSSDAASDTPERAPEDKA